MAGPAFRRAHWSVGAPDYSDGNNNGGVDSVDGGDFSPRGTRSPFRVEEHVHFFGYTCLLGTGGGPSGLD